MHGQGQGQAVGLPGRMPSPSAGVPLLAFRRTLTRLRTQGQGRLRRRRTRLGRVLKLAVGAKG